MSSLQHYGVKGMKWGVRRTPEQLGHRTSSAKPYRKIPKGLVDKGVSTKQLGKSQKEKRQTSSPIQKNFTISSSTL